MAGRGPSPAAAPVEALDFGHRVAWQDQPLGGVAAEGAEDFHGLSAAAFASCPARLWPGGKVFAAEILLQPGDQQR